MTNSHLAWIVLSALVVDNKTAVNIRLAIGNCTQFLDAVYFAAHTGIVPVNRWSTASFRGELPARSSQLVKYIGVISAHLELFCATLQW